MSDLEFSNPFDPEDFSQEKRDPAPFRPLRASDEIPAAPPPASRPPVPRPPAANPGEPAPAASDAQESPGAASPDPGRPVPWKAAASSVPKLRQQPALPPEAPAGEPAFQGFTQDEIGGPGGALGDSFGADETAGPANAPRKTSPLTAELPLWEAGLERIRAVPRSILIGAPVAVAAIVALISFLVPHGPASIPLARIRQHPEAYDGHTVKVEGRAGETFTVGGNFVFDLRQGRDTIVVYSRTRRPSLHERVEATGMVSIGYLDGAPRLALFEEPQTP